MSLRLVVLGASLTVLMAAPVGAQSAPSLSADFFETRIRPVLSTKCQSQSRVHYGPGQPWDDHKKIDENLRDRCPNMDQASAALIRDLKRRGLLDQTLVVWGGEFGRTPVSESGDGRDHNPYGFSMFMTGGGVKGGLTYGATDDFGFKAVENRVSIHDLHATILHLLGIDHEKLTYRYAGRDFRLTDVFGNVVKDILV